MTLSGVPGCTALLPLALALLARPAAGADALTKADVARLGKAATVYVAARSGTGSGFCVHPSGLFITSEHVVRGDTLVTVVLHPGLKGQQVLKARALRTDKELDLALLQADGQKDLPALPLGTTDKVTELAEVVACGFPFGDRLATDRGAYPAITINSGSVTSLRRKAGALHRLQLDVELNRGNSGGPVLDMSGRVVGVVAAGYQGARVNFAIPVSHVTRFVERPEVLFTPPLVSRAKGHEPVEFHARVVSVIPPAKPLSLELVLRAGDGPERRFRMDLRDGVYRTSAVPLPREDLRRLELSVQFEVGAVEGVAEDREIRVGAHKVPLSACRRLQRQPRAAVILADGKTLEGTAAGLDKVALALGGQTVTLDLSGATSVQVRPPRPAAAVECTVIARQGEMEVGRRQSRLALQGATLVEPADPGAVAIRPPTFAADRLVKTLPDIASDVRVGGGGRYLVLHLPKLKKLAVFDVTAAAITRYIPLAEGKVVYAAGLDKVVVGLTTQGVLERWDLGTGEKELARPLPGPGEVQSVLLGSASNGPVVVNGAFFDLETLKPLPVKTPHGVPPAWSPVSGDGTVFGAWKANQSPAESTSFVLQGDELKRYDEGGMGHVVPGPDGRAVYTAQGVRTSRLKALGGSPANPGYCLPAAEGDYFLALTPGERGKGGGLAVYVLGQERPVVRDAGIAHGIRFDGWDRETFGPWKRVFFVPRAKVIVVLPEGNDRLELYRFDVEEALERSGLDYLLVTSRPPATARRGGEYTYQVAVKSRKGGVRYQLASGPPGLEVSPGGLVKWRVPADYPDAACDVLLTVGDASGQEVFHAFRIRLTGG